MRIGSRACSFIGLHHFFSDDFTKINLNQNKSYNDSQLTRSTKGTAIIKSGRERNGFEQNY